MGLCAGEAGCQLLRIYEMQEVLERTGTMATVQLLLLTVGLTLHAVASVDEKALVTHAAAYRAGSFPATVDKVRALVLPRPG